MIGRRTVIVLRQRASSAIRRMSLAIGQRIRQSRPVRWAARRTSLRWAFGIALLLQWFLGTRVWTPGKRYVRRCRKFLGRHEVWVYAVVWGTCAFSGSIISRAWDTLDPTNLRILGGLILVGAFVLLCFRSPYRGLTLWLILSPMARTLVHFKFVEGMPLFTTDLAALLVLLVIYFSVRDRNAQPEPARVLHLTMFLFMLGNLISAYHAENPKGAAQMVIDQYLLPILIYLFARKWIVTKRQLLTVFILFLVIGAVFSTVAIPEYFTGRNIFAFGGRSAYIEYELGVARVQGPTGSPQELGLVLSLVITVALVWLPFDKSKYRKMLLAALVVLCFVAIGLTLRRSVYLAAIGSLLLMVFASRQPRRLVLSILAICILLGVASFGTVRQSKVFQKRLMSMRELYQRMSVQATALNIIEHNPVFGTGFDSYKESNRKYLVGYKDVLPWYGSGFSSPHSGYLRLLVDGGLVAFLPFVGMVIMFFVTSHRMYKRARSPGLLGTDGIIIYCAFAVGVLLQAASTDSFFHNRYLIALWMFYFGALCGVHLRPNQEQEEPAPVLVQAKSRPKRAFAAMRRT